MTPALRGLIAFDGAVACSLEPGAVNLVLRGLACDLPAEALLAGAVLDLPGGLPAALHAVSLSEYAPSPEDASTRRFRLQSQRLQLDLAARSVQLHRHVARAFFGAVAPPRVPFGRRLGWTVLLTLLRIPGVERLLVRLRGRA
jgi:hypothetical protein